jgi:hypothetical protein
MKFPARCYSLKLATCSRARFRSSPTLNHDPNLFPSNTNKGGLRLGLGLRLGQEDFQVNFPLRSAGVVLGFALPERRNVRLFAEAEK